MKEGKVVLEIKGEGTHFSSIQRPVKHLVSPTWIPLHLVISLLWRHLHWGMPAKLVTWNNLCHIPLLILILVSWSPSSLMIIKFLMHITCLQGEHAWLGQLEINFWSPSNYISHSKLLSCCPDFIHHPAESFVHERNLPRNLQSTQEYQLNASFWILEPKEPYHLVKPLVPSYPTV